MDRDEKFMRKALSLAKRGAGLVSPNPMVGAVIVKGDKIVSTGYHLAVGEDHAEISALKKIDFSAEGCELFINLEPCCHFGRTPPCVEKIIKSGIRRVVAGMIDPNPLVSGRGIEALKNAGIEVRVGVLEKEAKALNSAFIKWITTKRPLVTLKMAMTLDGKVAQRDQVSRWISCEGSRRLVHRMRAEYDSVMIGIGTALQDDPLLLPTLVKVKKYPIRIVIDGFGRFSLNSQLAKSADKGKILVFETEVLEEKEMEMRKQGIDVIKTGQTSGKVNLPEVLQHLGMRDITSVLLEGGPTLASSFIKLGLVDRFVIFIAPKLLGDPISPSLVADMGIRSLDSALPLQWTKIGYCGSDLVIEGVMAKKDNED